MKSIYKSTVGKEKILDIYNKLQAQLNTKFDSCYIDTRFGKTHILVGGDESAPPIICFHGGNVVNPITLKWFEPLAKNYRIYAPDAIGHPGKSDETRLNPKNNEYAEWVCDFMDGLGVEKAKFIGHSYGGGIIVGLAAFAPKRIEKAVLVAPSGIAGGKIYDMIRKILVPLTIYKIFPNDKNLLKACVAMFDDVIQEDVLLEIKYVYDYVKIETAFPKYATKEALHEYSSPTLLFAAENDVFFPSKLIVPRSEQIFSNLTKAVILQNSSHMQNNTNINKILTEIEYFFSN
ncbi:alpha/beta fold hydrolase [Clostridium akagii]|uniref:alpha/beta fold hydrolase n=1 Tax=Clostridium akagii TaxID=91623 RepID=UPI000478698E|nr:alpha/beta hydrolase [Clostridium akagii]